MRTVNGLLLCLTLLGCEGPTGPLRPDGGRAFDSGRRSEVDASTVLEGGPVSGTLCGGIVVAGSIEVPAGEELVVCAGSTITAATGARITVAGTLRLEGTAGARIQLRGDPRWAGLLVDGVLEADFTDVYDAQTAIVGRAGSSVRFDDGLVYAVALANVSLANGGSFDRSRIFGGGTMSVSGGRLSMTDTVLDLDHPGDSPDCLHVGGGTTTLEHVRITNCHCPIHITRADSFTVTASVLDGAAYPVMIANTTATFRDNVFEGTAADFDDIGGGIEADIAGNYYGGGAPSLATDDASQFTGAGEFLAEPPPGAGPR